jgi:hypothetical protein
MKRFFALLILCVLPLVSACEARKNISPVSPSTVSIAAAPAHPPQGGYPADGPGVIAYVAAQYPERLVGGISADERIANMKFLRDRVIETGKCAGLDLGWNLKRGGPEVSIDFIAERVGGSVIGHDIAFDYDNTGHDLQLYWGGGDFPAFKEYPQPVCN